jgi:hypothetical protein
VGALKARSFLKLSMALDGQKRLGRRETGSDPVVCFRLDSQLEKDLGQWRRRRPTKPSRSRAIRVLLRKALAAVEKE